jgi:Family of unknown function (DUF5681)/Bacterial sugar transferase
MMSPGGPPDDDEEGSGGYRRPPRTTRFTKGQSGNPAGRRRGRRREAPYEAVLGQMVTIREGGVERRVTAAEAFLLQLTKRGLEGDGAAARASLTAIEKVRERASTHRGPSVIIRKRVGFRGKCFECLKFRTMATDAPERLRQLLERDPMATAEWTFNRKLRNDPRVTAIGVILRRSSLDELPQSV